jgi:hypothetical protein
VKKTLIAFLAALALTGCTSLVPGSERVRVTWNPGDVVNCKIVGPMSGYERTMQDDALASGADTVLKTRTTSATSDYVEHWTAYNCSGVDPRQPVPVTKPR